jgi:hypothetical protein
MSNASKRPPAWFRVVSVALLLWALAGCYACAQQFRLGAEAMGPASDYDRALYASLPIWYNAVYAVAVGCGLLGAGTLLARSVLSIPLTFLSLLCVVIQFGWLFAATDIVAIKSGSTALFPLVIAAVALLSVLLARHARARGWIA